MVDLNDNLGFIGVQRIEVSDIALGGNEINAPNLQLKQLASRDLYLKNLIAPDTNAQNTLTQFQAVGIAAIAQGRLTLATGNSTPSTDLTAQTTLYYTPHIGDYISLWNSTVSRWEAFQFTQRSLSLTGLAANTNFDIFLYSNAGTLTLEAVAWSSSSAGASTRASALALRNGVWVKSSDNRRYLGTIRTTSTIGQCEDSLARRFVWNVRNQVARDVQKFESTSTWSYTTTTWRQYNNSAANRVEIVLGLDQFADIALSSGIFISGVGNFGETASLALGKNSTTTPAAGQIYGDFGMQIGTTGVQLNIPILAFLRQTHAAGYHFFQALEKGATSMNFEGTNGGIQGGISGNVFA